MKKTNNLPEIDLKKILTELNDNYDRYFSNNKNFQFYIKSRIENELVNNFPNCLNQSLTEICKIAKLNKKVFENYTTFWVALENEILYRQDSITNIQIADIVDSFSIVSATTLEKLNLFKELEETIMETSVPFHPFEVKKIFLAFNKLNLGSTPFYKFLTKKFIKNKSIYDCTTIAKFACALHKNKNSIKGDFGLIKELEETIKIEIDNLKFNNLITLAEQIFSNNLCSNDIHVLIEKAITLKFKKSIDLNIMKFIQLIKSLSNYQIKTDEFFHSIKNFLTGIINYKIADIKEKDLSENDSIANKYKENKEDLLNKSNKQLRNENNDISDNEERIDNKDLSDTEAFLSKIRNINVKQTNSYYNSNITKDINSNQNPNNTNYINNPNHANDGYNNLESIAEQNINLKYQDYLTKVTDNVNYILWMLSKNTGFNNLVKNDTEFSYLFQSLKDLFIRNISHYKPRDLLISLEAILKMPLMVKKQDSKIITEQLIKVKPTTTHDMLKLLKVRII